ncbi:ComEC/Rec2 family competence protein [Candidatus Lariskella endosymbiont of Epinotia ramella]|uniref:ComEC/Rec2 family competence protein n=1 Tax=Candidatus Lariskella endosymbiont of Epinotia ramella TaxID=3066224 RepID=UPI0030CFE19D
MYQLLILLVCLYILMMCSKRNVILYCVLAAVLCISIGYLAARFRSDSAFTHMIDTKIDSVLVIGKIENIEVRSRDLRLYLYDLSIDKVEQANSPVKIRINTREKNLALNVGDKIEVRCNILPPPRPMLPWGFDFSRHAYFKQIGAVGYATGKVRVLSKSQRHQNEQQDELYIDDKLNDEALFGEHDVQFKEVEEELYEKLAFGHGIFIELVVFVNKVRAKIVGILSSHMQKRTTGVASGLLVGDASSITDSDFKALRIAGIAHIIAISGMHIVLISTILFMRVFT